MKLPLKLTRAWQLNLADAFNSCGWCGSFIYQCGRRHRRRNVSTCVLSGWEERPPSQRVSQPPGRSRVRHWYWRRDKKKEVAEEESTHVDVICVDVVIGALQDDPRGIICRGRRAETGRWDDTEWRNENGRAKSYVLSSKTPGNVHGEMSL